MAACAAAAAEAGAATIDGTVDPNRHAALALYIGTGWEVSRSTAVRRDLGRRGDETLGRHPRCRARSAPPGGPRGREGGTEHSPGHTRRAALDLRPRRPPGEVTADGGGLPSEHREHVHRGELGGGRRRRPRGRGRGSRMRARPHSRPSSRTSSVATPRAISRTCHVVRMTGAAVCVDRFRGGVAAVHEAAVGPARSGRTPLSIKQLLPPRTTTSLAPSAAQARGSSSFRTVPSGASSPSFARTSGSLGRPGSPSVVVITTGSARASASRAIVPPVKMFSSSGCAWKKTATSPLRAGLRAGSSLFGAIVFGERRTASFRKSPQDEVVE